MFVGSLVVGAIVGVSLGEVVGEAEHSTISGWSANSGDKQDDSKQDTAVFDKDNFVSAVT